MPPKRRGPICGHTNPGFVGTPGSTGRRDASDPDHPIAIPDTRRTLGSLFAPGRIVLADAAPPEHIAGVQPGADPWTKNPGDLFPQEQPKYQVFQHVFPTSTSMAEALKWILDNSWYKPNTAISATFIEVSLVWLKTNKRFVAYTTQDPGLTVYTTKIKTKSMIFVAHVHPTQTELGANRDVVRERTDAPSRGDLYTLNKHFKHQKYSIIMHRDIQNNKTPCGFVYARANGAKVFHREKGAVFDEIAKDYMGREEPWKLAKRRP